MHRISSMKIRCASLVILALLIALITIFAQSGIDLPDITSPLEALDTTTPGSNGGSGHFSCKSEEVKILAWNSYWTWPDFGLGLGNSGFVKHNCSCSNCHITLDKNEAQLADAILVHGHAINDIEKQTFVDWKNLRTNGWPVVIFFNKESPRGTYPMLNPAYNDVFNVTMTYRRDSTVQNRFGLIAPTSKEAENSIKNGEWLPFPKDEAFSSEIDSERTHDIAWMVSHCKTNSKREVLANQLGELSSLTLDIYGKCGDREHKLPPETSKDADATLENRQKLYEKVLRKYKFYLSFENALCKDYITEKFYLAMNAGVIPIVYGGTSRRDYEKIAPPHSFIHVEDFKGLKELGQYLAELKQNPAEYNSYFWWKSHYEVMGLPETQWRSFCDLCSYLHKLKSGGVKPTKYPVFHKYWNANGICKSPKLLMS